MADTYDKGKMNYKDKIAVIKWHTINSELSCAESRVITLVATSANYLTGEYCESMRSVAGEVKKSLPSVRDAIGVLVSMGALHQVAAGGGHQPATYRVSTVAELDNLYKWEEKNPAYAAWDTAYLTTCPGLPAELEQQATGNCPECAATDGGVCTAHTATIRELHNTPAYRNSKTWLSTNPKPEEYITVIDVTRKHTAIPAKLKEKAQETTTAQNATKVAGKVVEGRWELLFDYEHPDIIEWCVARDTQKAAGTFKGWRESNPPPSQVLVFIPEGDEIPQRYIAP